MEIHFAPLQGYTDPTYRSLHTAIYGGIDTYYTPFIRIEKGAARHQDISRLEGSHDDGTNHIPQIIFNSVEEFETLVAAVKATGYSKIDLNLGCPFPMQTRKGRGAAMIDNVDTMKRIADIINADEDTSYSVKMRLGIRETSEWEHMMPILNDTRLAHITLHPRTADEMYDGELHPEIIDSFISQSVNPVIINGDILTRADIDDIASRYPALKGVMIGRGLLRRPSLAAEWRSGNEWSRELRLLTLLGFHDRLLEEYEKILCGQTQILQKIKPFWDYLEDEMGRKALKPLRKATTLERYRDALRRL